MDANSNLRFPQTKKSSRSPERHKNSHADAPVRISVNCEEGRPPGSVAFGTKTCWARQAREEKMRQRVSPLSAGSLGSLGTATAVAENNSVVSRWVMCVCVHSEVIDSVYRRVCEFV